MTDINVKLLDISSASDGDVLKYVAANGTVEYGAAPGASAINTSTVTVTAGSFYKNFENSRSYRRLYPS